MECSCGGATAIAGRTLCSELKTICSGINDFKAKSAIDVNFPRARLGDVRIAQRRAAWRKHGDCAQCSASGDRARPAAWHAPSAPRYSVPVQPVNKPTTSAAAAAVNGEVPFPLSSPVKVPAPLPPPGTDECAR